MNYIAADRWVLCRAHDKLIKHPFASYFLKCKYHAPVHSFGLNHKLSIVFIHNIELLYKPWLVFILQNLIYHFCQLVFRPNVR